MNIQSAINKEIFIPRDERMLVAVEVRRRKKKRMAFLPTGPKGDYATFICVSVTNTRPPQLLITKVKRFGGSSSFIRRSQWRVEQLQQVNGINPNKILYHACQTHWEGKAGGLGKSRKMGKESQRGRVDKSDQEMAGAGHPDTYEFKNLQARRKSFVLPKHTEFINCQSKLTQDARTMNLVIYRCKAFLNRVKNLMVSNQSPSPGQGQMRNRAKGRSVGNLVQRVNVTLGERGDRLTRAEDKTVELTHKVQQFADTAHKLALKYSK
ncbi:syntaxin binding protein 6 (amisyn), like isoform X3 [Oreochromis aureus]|uniref:syntaxin binding protein 6 (amisyn), like isoform X3 n=1 Tax=Oreochromis aureus TaxID=47969 RepID=UPI0012BC7265|nr:syntaxin binding protein 6 (amisyn), like isoform X3 [Oreochromis aureus]